MFVLDRLFSLLTALHVAPHPIAAIAREFPECVEEYGTDGLSGLDADELEEACTEW